MKSNYELSSLDIAFSSDKWRKKISVCGGGARSPTKQISRLQRTKIVLKFIWSQVNLN